MKAEQNSFKTIVQSLWQTSIFLFIITISICCQQEARSPSGTKGTLVKWMSRKIAGKEVRMLQSGQSPAEDGYYLDVSKDRNNPNYRRFMQWEPDGYRRKMLYSMLASFQKAEEQDLWRVPEEMPTWFAEVHWDGTSWYLYEPCDGLNGGTRLAILQMDPSAIGVLVEVHSWMESELYPVKRVIKANDEFVLYADPNTKNPIITIRRVKEQKVIYKISVSEPSGTDTWQFYATSSPEEFPLLINRCLNAKRAEFPWPSKPDEKGK